MNLSFPRKTSPLAIGACLMVSLASAQAVLANEPAAATEQPPASEKDNQSAAAPAALQAPAAAKPPAAPEWTFQMRTALGAGRVAQEKKLKSDRLGVGVYAGKRLSDYDIAVPFFDARNTSVGASYQTFTGVDAVADLQWALQSIGVMLRLGSSPIDLGALPSDLVVQTAVSYQRMVAQDPLSGAEKARHGAGVAAGAYLRTLAFDGVHVLGGADLLLGSASWFGLTLGLESNF